MNEINFFIQKLVFFFVLPVQPVVLLASCTKTLLDWNVITFPTKELTQFHVKTSFRETVLEPTDRPLYTLALHLEAVTRNRIELFVSRCLVYYIIDSFCTFHLQFDKFNKNHIGFYRDMVEEAQHFCVAADAQQFCVEAEIAALPASLSSLSATSVS